MLAAAEGVLHPAVEQPLMRGCKVLWMTRKWWEARSAARRGRVRSLHHSSAAHNASASSGVPKYAGGQSRANAPRGFQQLDEEVGAQFGTSASTTAGW